MGLQNSDKLEKVKNDIAKIQDRLTGLQSKTAAVQTKLRTLERQKKGLEDDQMITLIRSETISDSELTALINSFRKNQAADAATTNKTGSEEVKDEEDTDI